MTIAPSLAPPKDLLPELSVRYLRETLARPNSRKMGSTSRDEKENRAKR